ncbi:alginate O-acetyltransferase AlgF [Pandoraea commovens]|uniref:Alginate biosynthesis protein AlgF n=1 Tax=Pandoraea commovens TaxID=2508289 RepID=A0A5E4TDL9_9BURK|nr:alginate O-acetyltransferase AlgF [Pandoraea commovens]UVA79285.1 alginate O-acetyltransferase AlgF [Pandoraea commovens]VVD84474.1 cell morphology protein [Pandoraea commovens]
MFGFLKRVPCANRALAATALATVGLLAHAAPADDIAKLYALPPEGSVYVRVLNASNVAVNVQLGAGAKAESLAADHKIVSDYRVLPGAQAYTLKVNGRAVEVAGKSPKGGFVTLVIDGSHASAPARAIVDESPAADGLKAELAAYNLVPGCLAKIGVANGPTVFPGVADGARNARAINPVSASLVGSCADHASAPLALPALKGGDRYSVFLVGTTQAPVLVGATNRTQPYRAN